MKKLITLILVILFVNSCTIQKRRYMPGYDIQWKKDYKDKSVALDNETDASVKSKNTNYSASLNLASNEDTFAVSSNTSSLLAKSDARKTHVKNYGVVETITNNKLASKNKTRKASHFAKATTNETSDNYLYAFAAAILLFILGFNKLISKTGKKITRWAKSNPIKTKFLIAGSQISLLGLGIYSGHNLKELGVNFSNNTVFAFAGIMLGGFLVTPFFRKINNITTPARANLNRAGFIGIMIAFLMFSVGKGNRLGKDHSTIKMKHTVESSDHHLGQTNEISEMKDEMRKVEIKNDDAKRKRNLMLAAGGSVGLIILLGFLICVGLCVSVGGLIIAIGLVLGGDLLGLLFLPVAALGVLIIVGCVKGIQNNR